MLIVNENTPQVNQLSGFNKELFPYQLSTIYKMEELETGKYISKNGNTYEINTTYGVLSNKVGSGKSLILLGLCKRNKMHIDENQVYYKNYINPLTLQNVMSVDNHLCINNYISSSVSFKYNSVPYTNTTLIVVNVSLVNQWLSEIQNTNLSVFTVKSFVDLQELKKTFMSNFDIILCSNSFYNNLAVHYDYLTWNRVIFDEADSIKKITTAVKYKFVWLVTATPENFKYIYNKKNFIYSFNDSSNIEKINFVTVKCSNEYIDTYLNHTVNKFYIQCLTPVFINVIGNYISQEITQLLNAGDIGSAISKLGGNVEKDKDLIQVFTNKINNEILDLNNEIEYIKNIRRLTETQKTSRINTITEKINSCNVKLNSITEKINKINENNCCICIDNYVNPVMTSCCNNIFCFECITSSLKVKKQCVFCRKNISLKDLTVITDKKHNTPKKIEQKLLNKEEQCIEIIKNNPNGKFLIFSNYSFQEISNCFNVNSLKFKELKGGLDIINSTLKKYKEKDLNILLLNMSYKGSGLNLENTTDIVIFHEVAKELEVQLIGRALRLTRSSSIPLNIHYLKHNNEYIQN